MLVSTSIYCICQGVTSSNEMVLLSLLHLISYRLKIVFSPRYTRLAPFLPWVTKLVSLFLINLPHQTLCLCVKLSTCRSM